MTRPKSLQVHVSFELAERVRSAAERRDISVSEWIRSLLQQACDEDDLNVGLSTWLKRLNHHSVFTMVGVDALLSGHVDHGLRGRAHEAYVRRCEELPALERRAIAKRPRLLRQYRQVMPRIEDHPVTPKPKLNSAFGDYI